MATFAYSGRTRAGETVSGERVADSMDAAVAALRRDQILVTRITPAKAKEEPVAKKKAGMIDTDLPPQETIARRLSEDLAPKRVYRKELRIV